MQVRSTDDGFTTGELPRDAQVTHDGVALWPEMAFQATMATTKGGTARYALVLTTTPDGRGCNVARVCVAAAGAHWASVSPAPATTSHAEW